MNDSEKRKPSGFRRILKFLLITALIIVLPYVLLLGAFWIGGMWQSHIAETVIDVKASEYIRENYPENDFVVDNAFHVFKDNCYRVKVRSSSSRDTYFELDYDDQTHELRQDSYESAVLGGYNTCQRIISEYDTLVRNALEPMPNLHRMNIDFCRYSESGSPTMSFSPTGLDRSTLVQDRDYDVAVMANDYGYLELEFHDSEENIHILQALKLLTEADRILRERGVGYYVLELTLSNGTDSDNRSRFHIYGITKEDLTCADPLARLQEKWNQQEALRQERKAQQNKADP